ncbi:MAG: hypothetical protein A2Y75_01575 [Candidatus Solincola sediminis]|uniref:Uncharacterized protein n=1 Tax=Candidatus Solincola sediminis TaxID=1797199 RepID=A0A1F2WNJ8_9ACTN|nr:MAG: hypothetical protein A2Y75_01575 [Candidatus Solincola sediminis]
MIEPCGKQEAELWAVEGWDENITHSDMDECIGDYLNGLSMENWPTTIQVNGFSRMKAKFQREAIDLARELLVELWEEYGNQICDCDQEPSSKLIKITQELMDTTIIEFKPWACDQVESVEANVGDWLNKHAIDCWGEEEGKETLSEFTRYHKETP